MKRTATLGLILSALAAGVVAAPAAPPAESGPDDPSGHRPPHGAMAADLNQDGQVTADEFKQHHEQIFKKADVNADGQLDREEVLSLSRMHGAHDRAIPPAPGPEWRSGKRERGFHHDNPERFFSTLDANDDGKLQRDELPEALAAHMDRLDADGDGAISMEEMKQAKPDREALRSKMQARMKEIDTNGDGLIQADEAPERLRLHFDKIDANADGAIDDEEMKSFRPRPERRPGGKKPATESPATTGPRVIEN